MHRSCRVTAAAIAVGLAGCSPKLPPNPLFVLNSTSSTISVIDPTSLKLIVNIGLDKNFFPRHMQLSGDGTKLLTAASSVNLSEGMADKSGLSEVYVHDMSDGSRLQIFDVGGNVGKAAWTSDFTACYVPVQSMTPGQPGELREYSLSARDPVWTTPVGAGPLDVALLTGDRIVVANAIDGTLSVVDAASHGTVSATPVGAGPSNIWSTPAGIFVSLAGDKKVAIVDSGNVGQISGTYDTAGIPEEVTSVKAGGDVWIAVKDIGVVEVRDPSTGMVKQKVNVGGQPWGILVDDAAHIAYVTDFSGNRVIRVDTLKFEVIDFFPVGKGPVAILQSVL